MEAVSRNDLSAEPLLPQPLFDADRMRAYRRGRVLAEMEDLDIDLCLFTNPLTLRYVTEMREYSLFQSRIPTMRAAGRPSNTEPAIVWKPRF